MEKIGYYTEKQTLFAKYLLNKFGIDDDEFIKEYLLSYQYSYGEFQELFSGNGEFFDVSESIRQLIREKNIKDKWSEIKKNNQLKNYLNATDISNYTFCPASFSINQSFFIEYLTGEKSLIDGKKLHEKLSLIERIEVYKGYVQKSEISQLRDFFNYPEIKKILNSKIIYTGHNPNIESRKPFFNSVNKIYSDPDYIFIDNDNRYFVVEEKFHYYRNPDKAYYDIDNPKGIILGGKDGYIERVFERFEKQKKVFFKNNIVQLLVYLNNIDNFEIEYGYLVNWYYDYTKHGEPYIHDASIKTIMLDTKNQNLYLETLANIVELQENKTQFFDIKNVKSTKCAKCSVNKYCGHKSKKYNSLTFPYKLEYFKFFRVDYPEELKNK